MSLLDVKDLTIRYGQKIAVDYVSWSLGPGFHALLGPNGAGKRHSSSVGAMPHVNHTAEHYLNWRNRNDWPPPHP